MISMSTFVEEVKFLAEWFNKPLTEQIFNRLHSSVSEHLNDDEFRKACKLAFDQERYFPNTARFIELAHGSLEERASRDWAIAYTLASGTPVKDQLSGTGQKALKAIGGQSRIGRTPSDRQDFLRLEFVAAWKACYTPCAPQVDQKALPFERQLSPSPMANVASASAYTPYTPPETPNEGIGMLEAIQGILGAARAAKRKPSPAVLQKARDLGIDVSEFEAEAPTAEPVPEVVFTPTPQPAFKRVTSPVSDSKFQELTHISDIAARSLDDLDPELVQQFTEVY